jgi:hypothetical protein
VEIYILLIGIVVDTSAPNNATALRVCIITYLPPRYRYTTPPRSIVYNMKEATTLHL